MHTCAICEGTIWKIRDVCKGKIGYPQAPISALLLRSTGVEWKCDDGICKECSARLITYQGAAKVVDRMKKELLAVLQKNKKYTSMEVFDGDCEFEIEQLIEEDGEEQLAEDGLIDVAELKQDEFEELYEEETIDIRDDVQQELVKIDCIDQENNAVIVINPPNWQPKDENDVVLEEEEEEDDEDREFIADVSQRDDYVSLSKIKQFQANNAGTYPAKCTECTEVFKSLRGYRNHMKQSHFSGYVCEHCGKILYTRSGFLTHQQNHTESNEYVCTDCGQAFKNKSTLRHHQAWHTGLTPYKCEICSKQFVHYIGLYRHKKTHEPGTKRIKCEVCGFLVRTNAHLRRHMARHTGAKPHSCPICGKCFSQAYNMKVHVQEHQEPGSTRQRRLKCKRCSRTFRNKENYQDHVDQGDCDENAK